MQDGSVTAPAKEIIYRSWDTFTDLMTTDPCSAYISEHGSPAFDAALRLQAKNDSPVTARLILVSPKAFTAVRLKYSLSPTIN